ncbi:hypothetical protein BGZ80_002951, partial [Entomortierella chlamydospora]
MALINHINTKWGNPLRHEMEDGQWVIEDDTPLALKQLQIQDMAKSLSREDGMLSFLQDVSIEEAKVDRIVSAWNWLVQHNHLYQGFHHIQSPIGRARVNVPNNTASTGLFPSHVIHGLEPGPRSADMAMDGLN